MSVPDTLKDAWTNLPGPLKQKFCSKLFLESPERLKWWWKTCKIPTQLTLKTVSSKSNTGVFDVLFSKLINHKDEERIKRFISFVKEVDCTVNSAVHKAIKNDKHRGRLDVIKTTLKSLDFEYADLYVEYEKWGHGDSTETTPDVLSIYRELKDLCQGLHTALGDAVLLRSFNVESVNSHLASLVALHTALGAELRGKATRSGVTPPEFESPEELEAFLLRLDEMELEREKTKVFRMLAEYLGQCEILHKSPRKQEQYSQVKEDACAELLAFGGDGADDFPFTDSPLAAAWLESFYTLSGNRFDEAVELVRINFPSLAELLEDLDQTHVRHQATLAGAEVNPLPSPTVPEVSLPSQGTVVPPGGGPRENSGPVAPVVPSDEAETAPFSDDLADVETEDRTEEYEAETDTPGANDNLPPPVAGRASPPLAEAEGLPALETAAGEAEVLLDELATGSMERAAGSEMATGLEASTDLEMDPSREPDYAPREKSGHGEKVEPLRHVDVDVTPPAGTEVELPGPTPSCEGGARTVEECLSMFTSPFERGDYASATLLFAAESIANANLDSDNAVLDALCYVTNALSGTYVNLDPPEWVAQPELVARVNDEIVRLVFLTSIHMSQRGDSTVWWNFHDTFEIFLEKFNRMSAVRRFAELCWEVSKVNDMWSLVGQGTIDHDGESSESSIADFVAEFDMVQSMKRSRQCAYINRVKIRLTEREPLKRFHAFLRAPRNGAAPPDTLSAIRGFLRENPTAICDNWLKEDDLEITDYERQVVIRGLEKFLEVVRKAVQALETQSLPKGAEIPQRATELRSEIARFKDGVLQTADGHPWLPLTRAIFEEANL